MSDKPTVPKDELPSNTPDFNGGALLAEGQTLIPIVKSGSVCDANGVCTSADKPVTAEPLSYEATARNGFADKRPALILGILKETNKTIDPATGRDDREKFGNDTMRAARDGQQLIRDMQYKTGDVNTRTFQYGKTKDANGEYPVELMVVDSKKHGLQVWAKVPGQEDLWEEKVSKNKPGAEPQPPLQARMRVDQKTGEFIIQERGKEAYAYNSNGEWSKPSNGDKPVVTPAKTGQDAAPQGGEAVPEGGEAVPEVPISPEDQKKYEGKVEEIYSRPREIQKADPIIATSRNYAENTFNAADDGKPIVATFGHGSAQNVHETLDAVGRSANVANGSAHFMYVDLDKVDPNSEIGKYAKYIEQDFMKNNPNGGKRDQEPFTIVYNMQPGDGKPYKVIPDKPMHFKKGVFDEAEFNDKVAEAVKIQQAIPIDTGRGRQRPDQTKEGSDSPVPPVPAAVKKVELPDMLKEVTKPIESQRFDDLMKGMSPVQKLKTFSAAIDAIDKMARDYEERKDFNPADQAQVARVEQFQKLRANMRAATSMASIGWGKEAESKGPQYKAEADGHYMRGAEYMMSAGSINPNVWQYPKLTQAFRESALPGTAAQGLIERGASNPRWFEPTQEEMDYAKSIAPGIQAADIKAAQGKGDTKAAESMAKSDYVSEIAGQKARERYQKVIREDMRKPRAGSDNNYKQYGPTDGKTPPVEPNPYDYNGAPRDKAS